jgi:hypothetical protein
MKHKKRECRELYYDKLMKGRNDQSNKYKTAHKNAGIDTLCINITHDIKYLNTELNTQIVGLHYKWFCQDEKS